uniref:Uncharacterized protein n=1 Tax=Vespula pensylvanica TaxID=30213 RepID=A0A834P6X9_VESPE|nr:hypothetical protein H0235_004272 [Vespula pensylvanica]
MSLKLVPIRYEKSEKGKKDREKGSRQFKKEGLRVEAKEGEWINEYPDFPSDCLKKSQRVSSDHSSTTCRDFES